MLCRVSRVVEEHNSIIDCGVCRRILLCFVSASLYGVDFLVRSVPFVSQELLLILDEYWQANPHLQHIPIWYASKLASRALRVYQTYANMMNARIRAQMDVSNPFSFRYIQNLKSIDVNTFDDSVPSVVFASPGMLQSGVSRQLFDRWATDPKNGVMIAAIGATENAAPICSDIPRAIRNEPIVAYQAPHAK